MLKLILQNFGHLMQRTDSLEKTLMLLKTEGRREGDNRGWDGWMASLIWWTWVWVSSGSWWWTGKPGVLQSMGLQRVRHNWVNWTELDWTIIFKIKMLSKVITPWLNFCLILLWIKGVGITCSPGIFNWISGYRKDEFWAQRVSDLLWWTWRSLVSLVAQMAIQKTQVLSLGQKHPLKKGIATHSSILAWRIPWTEESGGLPSMVLQTVGHN